MRIGAGVILQFSIAGVVSGKMVFVFNKKKCHCVPIAIGIPLKSIGEKAAAIFRLFFDGIVLAMTLLFFYNETTRVKISFNSADHHLFDDDRCFVANDQFGIYAVVELPDAGSWV